MPRTPIDDLDFGDALDPDFGPSFAVADGDEDCGRQPDGSCSKAGSEACEFECPFRGTL